MNNRERDEKEAKRYSSIVEARKNPRTPPRSSPGSVESADVGGRGFGRIERQLTELLGPNLTGPKTSIGGELQPTEGIEERIIKRKEEEERRARRDAALKKRIEKSSESRKKVRVGNFTTHSVKNDD